MKKDLQQEQYMQANWLNLESSQNAKCTYYNDGVKVWNRAPNIIKNCKSIWAAKKAIKLFGKTLPL